MMNNFFVFISKLINKSKKKILVLFIFFLFLNISYLLSYCFALPAIENTIYVNYAYTFFQPIEYCRLHCRWFWKLAEYGYNTGEGKVPPLCRRNEKGSFLRRALYFDKNGYLMREVIASFGYKKVIIFNKEGEIITEGIIINNKKDGTFYTSIDNSISTYKDGVISNIVWKDKNGVIIGECSFKKGKPYDGKFYELTILDLQTYEKGVLTKHEEYNIRQKTVPENGARKSK